MVVISSAACAARGALSALITSQSLGWSIVYKVAEDFLLVQIEMFLIFFGLLTHVWMIVVKNYRVIQDPVFAMENEYANLFR